MPTEAKKQYTTRGSFNEVFWNHEKDGEIAGTFTGFLTKTIDKEERRFAVVKVEGKDKPFLCGGRDLLSKLTEEDKGKEVKIKFDFKDSFTPKGTKKKVPINRYVVEVAE